MFKRNLENLKKFLTLTEEKDLKCGLIAYVFDNEDQEIRTDLLIDRIMNAIQDKQKPFICHTWNDQWLINIRMANQEVSFLASLHLNPFNKIESVYILEHLWHYIQNTDQIN